MTEITNIFCSISELTNEASVEARFINPLLEALGYSPKDIALKTAIGEFKVGKGSKSSLYKPDYIIMTAGIPSVIIEAKSPVEDIEDWESQCSSYCLELNKCYDYNPVQYYVITNGLVTSLYQWDRKKPIASLKFIEFLPNNDNYNKFKTLLESNSIKQEATKLKETLEDSEFEFKKIPLSDLTIKFQKLHQYIWTKEKMSPSASFEELIKIIFVKIQKDRSLYNTLGNNPHPKYKDVVFSLHWIANQTENESPINDPLFRNLVRALEKEIQDGKKKRIFNEDEQINLDEETIKWIVKEIEHIDFAGMEEDIHGRIFESFLDATVRGRELGQFFTPRDIVSLMVELANIEVSKQRVDIVLDACCGSGGFLIAAINVMLNKLKSLVGISNVERKKIGKRIQDESLFGIDAGSNPAIYRIARMNMYLHGDGGSNIFFADSLDKSIGRVGRSDIEGNRQHDELKDLLIARNQKFDVILSNPPFSMQYSKDDSYQAKILAQYNMGIAQNSLFSSVMFIERYKELISQEGKIFAIIDESILSGSKYASVRKYIRENFIIIGIISLPGDAFRRASARVKTSIIILRLKKPDEEQTDVFMTNAVYTGLEGKVSQRIGISAQSLQEEKVFEKKRIIADFKKYNDGIAGNYLVSADSLSDRLDVKFCINDRGRKENEWKSKGLQVTTIGKELSLAAKRKVKVSADEIYQFLRVNYDGDIIDGDVIDGQKCSYSSLYIVKEWDILLSNMGVGRGAIGIVPPYHSGKFVSNEYTIVTAKTHEEAVYYSTLIRTKEILGDILSTTTGMNRGRINWDNIRHVKIPAYHPNDDIKKLVEELEEFWIAYEKFNSGKTSHMRQVIDILDVDGEDAHKRWLAFKPPE